MIKAKNPNDLKLLNGLLNADRHCIREVYDLALPAVIQWVRQNRGQESDARDIFQEALLALYKRLESGDFQLTCQLKSYLRILCRNLWLTRLRDNQKYSDVELGPGEEIAPDQLVTEQIEQSERQQLYRKHFDRLGENCRKILRLSFDKVPQKEIAQKLNLSEAYVKKRKFLCKKQLIESIKADAVFKELTGR